MNDKKVSVITHYTTGRDVKHNGMLQYIKESFLAKKSNEENGGSGNVNINNFEHF